MPHVAQRSRLALLALKVVPHRRATGTISIDVETAIDLAILLGAWS